MKEELADTKEATIQVLHKNALPLLAVCKSSPMFSSFMTSQMPSLLATPTSIVGASRSFSILGHQSSPIPKSLGKKPNSQLHNSLASEGQFSTTTSKFLPSTSSILLYIFIFYTVISEQMVSPTEFHKYLNHESMVSSL